MDNTNDKIFFNFSYFALKLLGKGLYSNPWTAIAELVANGLDAKATCVRIFIDMSDKKNSEIEIFDNGTGMTYSDLAEKYVLIGKNKREDLSLDEVSKNKVMGRKGIGKLAALYLSSKYLRNQLHIVFVLPEYPFNSPNFHLFTLVVYSVSL